MCLHGLDDIGHQRVDCVLMLQKEEWREMGESLERKSEDEERILEKIWTSLATRLIFR